MWTVVWEVGCLGCRMFGMRDVWDEGYLRCRVFVMQDIYRIVGRWFKNVICKLHLLSKNVSKINDNIKPLTTSLTQCVFEGSPSKLSL